MKDQQLLELVQSGNEDKVIKSLHKTAWPKVRRYILSHNGNLEQAEDVFHDSLVKLLLKLRKDGLNGITEIHGYLFIMVRNLWITTVGRNKKVTVVETILDREDPMTKDNSLELSEMMETILEQLGDVCRKLLKLTYFENASLEVAAEKIGLSGAEVARTYHYRCKKKLLEQVETNSQLKELLYDS